MMKPIVLRYFVLWSVSFRNHQMKKRSKTSTKALYIEQQSFFLCLLELHLVKSLQPWAVAQPLVASLGHVPEEFCRHSLLSHHMGWRQSRLVPSVASTVFAGGHPPSTNWMPCCLASVILREPAGSGQAVLKLPLEKILLPTINVWAFRIVSF